MLIHLLIPFIILQSVWSLPRNPILIVVSYDAFRYDYLDPNLTPNMLKLRKEGTFAEYIYNVFPTKTFPNHFTIATGMYTEVHGVVGNSFYDPDLKKIVTMGEEMFTQNKEIIPIWTLNELSGADRYSGLMMWPGCPFPYKNKRPTYLQNWSRDYDLFKRVDKIMEWLTDLSKPANFIMMYVEEPDFYSHIYGPDSDVVHERIKVLDKLSQYLDDQLYRHKLKDLATVVHLSDHGMSSVKMKDIINITQLLQPNTYMLAETSPCMHVIPKEGFENSIYDTLKKASDTLKTFDVYKKEDMPERWHMKKNSRAPPIFLMAKDGYAFQDILEAAERYKTENHLNITPETTFGLHGFDPEMQKMHPFFMVRGPNVQGNHLIKPFNFVDLYNFFTEVLEIETVPNNGTVPIWKDILIHQRTDNSVSSVILVAGILPYFGIFIVNVLA